MNASEAAGCFRFLCPACGAQAAVSQVQGDRCPGCGSEFKWFAPGEETTVQDYLTVLTGNKYVLSLPEGQGSVIAHE